MPAKATPFAATSASQAISCVVDGVTVKPTALFGWSVAETTGSAGAKVRLRDGALISSPVVSGLITLVQGESVRDWFGDQSVELFNGGIYLEVVSGSVEGAVWWG